MADYISITEDRMRNLLQKQMGFSELKAKTFKELVFQRRIVGTDFAVRVYSSINIYKNSTLKNNSIRVGIYQISKRKLIKESITRINRTKHALSKIREQWRICFIWVKRYVCPECGSLMIPKKIKLEKYIICSSFTDCSHRELMDKNKIDYRGTIRKITFKNNSLENNL